jgi:hypothetical protein
MFPARAIEIDKIDYTMCLSIAAAESLRSKKMAAQCSSRRRPREGVYEIAEIPAERIYDEGEGNRAMRRASIVDALVRHNLQLCYCLLELGEVGHASVVQQHVREGLEDTAKGGRDLGRYEAETLPIKVVSCGRAPNECDVAAQAP